MEEKTVSIRRFAREDAEELRRRLYPDTELSEVSEMIEEWNSGACGGRAFDAFAIVSEGRIVGYVSLCEQSRSIASAGIEVAGEERRRGAATEALSQLMRYAKEKGCGIILDQVRRDNAASIRLHEKLGFETDGYVYRNKRDHEVLLYLKRL